MSNRRLLCCSFFLALTGFLALWGSSADGQQPKEPQPKAPPAAQPVPQPAPSPVRPPVRKDGVVYDTPKAYQEARHLICGWKDEVTLEEARKVIVEAGLTIEHAVRGAKMLRCPVPEQNLEKALAVLNRHKDVILYVQPDYLMPVVRPRPPGLIPDTEPARRGAGEAGGAAVEGAVVANRAPERRDRMVWSSDYGLAQLEGRRDRKPLAVFLAPGPSGWDRVSKEGRLSEETQRLLQTHYLCVHVDTSAANGQRLAERFQAPGGLGLVLSDHSGALQAFHHTGTIAESDLTRSLRRYSDPGHVVSATDTLDSSSGSRQEGQAVPNDPDYKHLWGMDSIRAPQAWATVNSTPIVVAVLDTGVDWNHEDLKDNMYFHDSKLSTSGPIVGIDFGIDPNNPVAKPGPVKHAEGDHGIHVAGTIGAVGNNKVGVAGVNWGVKIMALQVFAHKPGPKGHLNVRRYAAAHAAHYAVENGAKVLNLSWGGYHNPDPALANVIRRAQDRALFVIAAGNDNHDNDDPNIVHYPANIPYPNVISVAAINRQERLATFGSGKGELEKGEGSNFGRTTVHLAAPGGEMIKEGKGGILSTVPDFLSKEKEKYKFGQGTSMACPHVAGAAALVWGQPAYRNFSPAQIKELLMKNARKLPALQGKCISEGTLDISFLSQGTYPPVPDHHRPCYVYPSHYYYVCPPHCYYVCPPRRHCLLGGRLFGRFCR